ncbi:recombinase family protein [Methylorubrum aminovorans]
MRFVSYLRVSTEDQGRDGLGMDAQRGTIARYLDSVGGEIIAGGEFVEVESGKHDDRPELLKARARAAKMKATLIVAKLDRLSRESAFISTFLRGERRGGRWIKPDFVSCDYPTADVTMLQMAGVFAELERRKISERTRDALAVKKAQGAKLGNPRPAASLAQGRATRVAKANESKARVMISINDIRAGGTTTLKGIAEALNERGVKTSRGGEWSATQVSRVQAA